MWKAISRAARLLVVAGATAGLAFFQGCASAPTQQAANGVTAPAPPPEPGTSKVESGSSQPGGGSSDELEPGASARQVGPRISTYYLSADDEIRISISGYPDLARTVRIPPDGHLFFPMVGDITVDGMSIPELRKLIANGLSTADEQRISTGDRISIRVYRNDDLNLTTTVPSSGRVSLPLAGEVDVVGLTVEEASEALAERLSPYVIKPSVSTTIEKAASGLPGRITNPHVSIEVMAFGGHKIMVLGEVQRPGVYVNSGGSRLLEMVALAGGPTEDAKLQNVALVRPATETSQALTAVVNLDQAMKAGDLSQNPPVQRGDVIYVPKRTFASVAQFFDYIFKIVRPFAAIVYPSRVVFQ